MSIVAYTGLPGSGKSYSAVENFIIPALRDGRPVCTNLQLSIPCLTAYIGSDVSSLVTMFPMDIPPEELISVPLPGSVIIIDEVWRYWPGGIKANDVPKDQLQFFKEHRHRTDDQNRSTEIVIMDQDIGTGIPAFLRSLIETTYIHTKLSSVSLSNRFRVEIYARAQSASRPSKAQLLRKMNGKYKPEIFNCYISHTQASNLGEAGLEKIPDGRATIWKSWPIISAGLAFLFLLFIIPKIYFIFNPSKSVEDPSPIVDSQAIVVATPVPRPNPVLPPIENRKPLTEPSEVGAVISTIDPPNPSSIWRVSGGIKMASGDSRIVLVSKGRYLYADEDSCVMDHLGNWRCTVSDGVATMFSGPDFARNNDVKKAIPF